MAEWKKIQNGNASEVKSQKTKREAKFSLELLDKMRSCGFPAIMSKTIH